MKRLIASKVPRYRGWRMYAWLITLALLCRGMPVSAETMEERIQTQQDMTVESNESRAGPQAL